MSNTTSEVYLVLGGEGFLGHNIINQLLGRKNSTHPNIKIKSFDIQKRYDLADVEVIVGDMCSYQDLKDAFQGVTTVIQTASPIASAPDHLFWKVNVEGMKNVIKVCQDVGVKKLVFTSSASVVYGGEPLNGVDETSPYPQKFVDVYSETKSIAEKMVLEANSTSLATVSLRVAGLFGIGDRQMIPRLVNLHETGQTKVQVGDNTNLFDYTYIENAAYAHLLASDKLPSPEVAGNSFFITNTTPIPFWDMPRRVWGILGLEKSLQYTLPYSVGISIAHAVDYLLWAISPIKKIEITLKPYAIRHSCSNRYFNTEKAQNILGYKPLFSLEEGLQKTLKSIIDEKNSKN